MRTFKIMILLVLFHATLLLVSAYAQDLSGHNLCIDPGHGPGNSNQGPTGLHEHVINWKVANFLKEYCLNAGMDTVILTRDSLSDPPLHQRETVANGFGSEWFHSVHHNATGWQENNIYRYTLVLYEEITGHQPQWPGQSDVMSNLISEYIWQGLRTSHWVVFGDYSFYGTPSYLGVLNDLQMPGELSEGTFHDHPWEEAKLYNPRFNRMEARGIFKALTTYFNAGDIEDGCISGIITDAISGEYMNDVTVILNNGTDTTCTDNHNSGFYNFYNLQPGNYEITARKAGYEEARDSVEVGPHRFDFLDFEMVDISPPVVEGSTPDSGNSNFHIWADLILNFNKPMNIAATEEAISLTPPINISFKWSNFNRTLTIDPAGPLEFSEDYQLIIEGTAADEWNHPIDGNSDGVGGDAFNLSFRTETLTHDYPVVLSTEPVEQSVDVFPLDVIRIHFNNPMNPGTMLGRNLLIMNSYNIRSQGYGNYTETDSGDYIFSFCPFEPMRPNNHHLATLLYLVQDSTGTNLPDHFRFDFTTSNAQGNFILLDSLSSFSKWSVSSESTGISDYSIASTDSDGVVGEGYTELNISFLDTGAVFLLNYENPPFDSLFPPEPRDFYGLYVYTEDDPVICKLLFKNNGELLFSSGDTTDWKGWGLIYTEIPDLINTGEFAGISIEPFSSLSSNIRISRLFKLTSQELGISVSPAKPLSSFNIRHIYPNPFNAETLINITLPEKQSILLSIYNLQGKLIATIFSGELSPGEYQFRWDGRNNTLEKAPSGVYFVRLASENMRIVKKVTLLY